jgi:hypothetical protein
MQEEAHETMIQRAAQQVAVALVVSGATEASMCPLPAMAALDWRTGSLAAQSTMLAAVAVVRRISGRLVERQEPVAREAEQRELLVVTHFGA